MCDMEHIKELVRTANHMCSINLDTKLQEATTYIAMNTNGPWTKYFDDSVFSLHCIEVKKQIQLFIYICLKVVKNRLFKLQTNDS
mmetsp:Transcript_48208/g.80137  ORF Transcript_48208/g.80137 Transcript_48208/m.80137 type:complete len:85 (-) Transcript_48208:430-684(-)